MNDLKPSQKSGKVLIVILNWNGLDDTTELLNSLQNVTTPLHTIIIIDNNSANNEATILHEKFPQVIIHSNNKNLGYAGGNNSVLPYLQSHEYEYVSILNNDLTVTPNFLDPLVRSLSSDKSVGITCSVVRDYKHRERIQSAGGLVNTVTGWVELYHKIPNNLNVTLAPGSCFLIRAESFLNLGGFDTDFFAYWEDSDLSVRLRESGLQCRVVPESIVYHKTSSSSKYLSRIYVYYMLRNQIFFMRKHCPVIYRPVFLLFFFLRNVPAYLFLTLRQKSGSAHVIPKAIIDGFRIHFLFRAPQSELVNR